MSTPYEPAPVGPPVGEPPPSNLVWAILSTFLCSIIPGIVSIVFASQVNSKWAAGDVEGARQASGRARLWAIIAAVLGLLGWALIVVGLVTGVAAGLQNA